MHAIYKHCPRYVGTSHIIVESNANHKIIRNYDKIYG